MTLQVEKRGNKTSLITNSHIGPLRVQRPFYPEYKEDMGKVSCCHLYLLHPPGGMVLGDSLQIHVTAAEQSRVLLTTPSAGKVYGVQEAHETQCQEVELCVKAGASLEWLPQETIVFNGANARLTTRVKLSKSSKACIWDIVCLGRPASNDLFTQGRCEQTLEVWEDGKLLLLEKNRFEGGSDFMLKSWGLQGGNTSGTLCATVKLSRESIDEVLIALQQIKNSSSLNWGLTQKDNIFIARYIGNSSLVCRQGFELIWSLIRVQMNQRNAVIPRIWNT